MSSLIHESLIARRRILLGGGGHGRVLVDALRACRSPIDGVLDERVATDIRVQGVPRLGNDDWLLSQSADAVILINGVGANPFIGPRQGLFDRWRSAGYSFLRVIHPSAMVSPDCSLGEGLQALALSVIQPGAVIGDNVVLNTGAVIEHDVRVDSHAFIGPGVIVCGDAQIGRGAFVGAGAVILPGVKIGNNVIVAAGATVIEPVPDGAVVLGNPAREQPQIHFNITNRGRTEN